MNSSHGFGPCSDGAEPAVAVFLPVVLVLAGGSSLLFVVLVWRRIWLATHDRRRQRIETALRPSVLAFIDAGTPLPTTLSTREQEAVVDILSAYARLVDGPARARIADFLERQGIVDRELAALTHKTAWRRAAAAYRLGDAGSLRAVDPLLAALDDPDRDVRAAAARSLGRLHSADAVERLLATLVGRQIPEAIVRWALLQIGQAALPRLRGLVGHEEPEERAGALQLIGLLGGAGDSASAEACLRDTAARVREQAALALGRIGGTSSVPPLLSALADRVPAVRAAAAVALGRLRDQRAIEPLLAQARSDAFEPARAAAQALAGIDRERVIAAGSTDGAHLREAADLVQLA